MRGDIVYPRFKKHLEYLKYLLKHKYYVGIQCVKLGLVWQAIAHDLSKFLPREWIPYVEHFYGRNPDAYKEEFDLAWLLHQHKNPHHHHQYWILKKDDGSLQPIPMPQKYILEMLCDWWGAGRALGKEGGWEEVKNWYSTDREKMLLHESTRREVEYFLRNVGWWEND